MCFSGEYSGSIAREKARRTGSWRRLLTAPARAAMSADLGLTSASVVDGPRIKLRDARHPLLVAARNGEAIPPGWATDSEGRPTTDPQTGFDGFLLPVGGHKGFGLSLLVDILCGLITGGSFQHQLKSMYRYPDDPSNTAHMMIAVNPLVFMDRQQLADRMSDFVTTIKESPMWDPDAEMLLPGELEHRKEVERRKTGIPIPGAVYRELEKIGNEMNLDVALVRVAA